MCNGTGCGGHEQPSLSGSTLEDVLECVGVDVRQVPEPAPDSSRDGWYLHLHYYAATGKKTGQLNAVVPSLYPVLAAFVNGEPVMYKRQVLKDGDVAKLAFGDPVQCYSVVPVEPVKTKEIRWRRVYIVGDDDWLEHCEPQPVVAGTRNDPNYLGTLVMRYYYEDGVLVEQATQFMPKF